MKHATPVATIATVVQSNCNKKQREQKINFDFVSPTKTNSMAHVSAFSWICLLRVRPKDLSSPSLHSSLIHTLFPSLKDLSVYQMVCRLLRHRNYNFSQKTSIIVIVRKFTVDAAQLPSESSQREETERNVGQALQGFQFSSSQKAPLDRLLAYRRE